MKIARWQIYIICSYLLLVLYFIICRIFFLKFYLQSLLEDQYVEWAQFYLLVFASILSFKLVRDMWSKERHINYFYILCGLFCMLAAMDEISWGQRIFGFESPQFFKNYNAQEEMDFHNVMKEFIDDKYPLVLFGIIYGIALPVVVSYSRKSAAIFQRLNLVVPPRVLIIGFSFGVFFIGLAKMEVKVMGIAEEIGELFIFISLFYFLLIQWNEQRKDKAADGGQINFSRNIVKFSLSILGMAVLSTLMINLGGDSYGPRVDAYDMAYAGTYAYYGFYKEAVESYEKALGIKSSSQDYSFLKNLNNAAIELPPFVQDPIFFFHIGGDLRPSLFAHPPSKITYKLTIPDNPSLTFGIALNPEVWSTDKGDGVLFELYVQDGGMPEKVFSKYIDPKHNVADRKWHDERLNLSKYAGKEVELSFITKPGFGNNADFDWAVWADPRLISINKRK